MTALRLLGAGTAAAAVLAGCGGTDASSAPERPLNVQEALDAGGPVRVRGTLIVEASGVRLCTAILESHPPQCGQPSLRVRGLDFVGVSNMEQAKGIRWTSREVTLVGAVEDGVLTVVQ